MGIDIIGERVEKIGTSPRLDIGGGDYVDIGTGGIGPNGEFEPIGVDIFDRWRRKWGKLSIEQMKKD